MEAKGAEPVVVRVHIDGRARRVSSRVKADQHLPTGAYLDARRGHVEGIGHLLAGDELANHPPSRTRHRGAGGQNLAIATPPRQPDALLVGVPPRPSRDRRVIDIRSWRYSSL